MEACQFSEFEAYAIALFFFLVLQCSIPVEAGSKYLVDNLRDGTLLNEVLR
jgi:hypothetical protein